MKKLFTAFALIIGFYASGQSYIGKSYDGILNDFETTFKDKVDWHVTQTAEDGSKSLHIYFLNKQNTSFAFDFQDKCLFYLVVMPDTSGQQTFTEHLTAKYIRNPPDKWIERRPTGDIVWYVIKSLDERKTLIFVYPLKIEDVIYKAMQESLYNASKQI
jgi:hypothetical protein